MSASNKKSKYAVAKFMHWAVGVIILFNLLSGWRLGTFELDVKQVLLMVHSGVGTVIFLGMLYRWWWRKSNNLYAPRGWCRRPSMQLQWVFYPLVPMQVVIGVTLAAFIDYEALGLGFIPYWSVAHDLRRRPRAGTGARAWKNPVRRRG